MNLVSRLMRAIGLDLVGIGLHELSNPVRPGGALSVVVELTEANGHPTRVERLRVALDEELMIYTAQGHGDFDFWRTIVSLKLPLDGRVLAPGESLRVPVALSLPATLEPSAAHRQYRLNVSVGPRGLGPTNSAIVTVCE